MKNLKKKFVALKIEYHWHCIYGLQKKQKRKNRPTVNPKMEYHKFKAEQYSIEYEFYLGLRNSKGKIIA